MILDPAPFLEGATRVEDEPRAGSSFIERQFPVAKLSKESYGERTAKQSQTLTGLGKWWGRKPLVLVRATILGLLVPASDDDHKDREVFLMLMSMDEDGLRRRKDSSIPLKEVFRRLPPHLRETHFRSDSNEKRARYKRGVKRDVKTALQNMVFTAMSYDEKLRYCRRPEQVDGPSEEAWKEINGHLGTSARSLPELVAELGRRRFGRIPRVGDAFCGGGAVPFEAARIGCEAYGSDLNPVAALLTWASINIVGGGEAAAREVTETQRTVFEAADRQVVEWGIEKNELGWRADAYLYCIEATCPECGWRVPLAPSWVVGEKTRCVVRLVPDQPKRRFDFQVESGVADEEMEAARRAGTAKDSSLVCANPECGRSTPLKVVRGDARGGLRLWENHDLVPRPEDVFGERLYCMRWLETVQDADRIETIKHYRAPTSDDLEREERVLVLLRERFDDWQVKGYIPRRRIEPGDETARLMRERGWTHWHHLFNPRQLLVLGLLGEALEAVSSSARAKMGSLLAIGRCADWNSRLSRWHPNAANEKSEQVFHNQALNTLRNYGTRPLPKLRTTWFASIGDAPFTGHAAVAAADARAVDVDCDIWLTDPPYADAINYSELSEFFLSWYEIRLPRLLPEIYTDSKRALAIRGEDESFRQAMVDCYKNLAAHMPDDGLQVVMFTHQDAGVWADLALILWAAGLRVTAAWCIATETDSPLKEGNYVQGTVLLVLRKQTSRGETFLDEVHQKVEVEVRRQLDSMRALDDVKDPNFSDTDYQLAAYAAALRVLTEHPIAEIDVAHELRRARAPGDPSPLRELVERAVRIACDHLLPRGIETHVWKGLAPVERLYLKGLELESHGEYRTGVYQELARGFGVEGYGVLLASDRANQTRLKTPGEFGRRELGGDGFGSSVLRQLLFAVLKTADEDDPAAGLRWLRDEVADYWNGRERLAATLDFLACLGSIASMPHWQRHGEAAFRLAGAVRNDHV